MDYLRALREALAIGLTRDQFHTIWEREMQLKILTHEACQTGNSLNAQLQVQYAPVDVHKSGAVSELCRNLNQQTRDIRELKLESEHLRLELSDLSQDLLNQNKEFLKTAIEPAFRGYVQDLEDITGKVQLVRSDIKLCQKITPCKRFSKQAMEFHEQLRFFITALKGLKPKACSDEGLLTKDTFSNVHAKRGEKLVLGYTDELMTDTNQDQQVKHIKGQRIVEEGPRDLESSHSGEDKSQTAASRDGDRNDSSGSVWVGDINAGNKYRVQVIERYGALGLPEMKTSGTIEKHEYYQRKLGKPTTNVSQTSDRPQLVNNGSKTKHGRCLIDHQPLSHGQPAGHGQPISQGQPISYGQPISHGQPMIQGQSVGHGQPVGHLQPTSDTQLTSKDLTTNDATSTDDDQPGHEICDLKMLPLQGAELRICIEEALSATEEPYTSSFYYTHFVACKVQLHVRFLKDGHLAVHVALVRGDLDHLHKWPVEFSGNGYIFNASTSFSELWTIKSTKLYKPETEAVLKAEVCLKTARDAICDIKYTKLKDLGYQYNGYFRFVWDLKAKESI